MRSILLVSLLYPLPPLTEMGKRVVMEYTTFINSFPIITDSPQQPNEEKTQLPFLQMGNRSPEKGGPLPRVAQPGSRRAGILCEAFPYFPSKDRREEALPPALPPAGLPAYTSRGQQTPPLYSFGGLVDLSSLCFPRSPPPQQLRTAPGPPGLEPPLPKRRSPRRKELFFNGLL